MGDYCGRHFAPLGSTDLGKRDKLPNSSCTLPNLAAQPLTIQSRNAGVREVPCVIIAFPFVMDRHGGGSI